MSLFLCGCSDSIDEHGTKYWTHRCGLQTCVIDAHLRSLTAINETIGNAVRQEFAEDSADQDCLIFGGALCMDEYDPPRTQQASDQYASLRIMPETATWLARKLVEIEAEVLHERLCYLKARLARRHERDAELLFTELLDRCDRDMANIRLLKDALLRE